MELRKIKMVSVVIYIYIKCCSDQSHKGGNFEDVVSIMLNYCKKTTKQTLSETFITSRLVDNSDNLGQNFCTCPFEKILQKSSKGPPLWNHHIFCFCSCCSFKVWNWFQCILCWLEKNMFRSNMILIFKWFSCQNLEFFLQSFGCVVACFFFGCA